MFTLSVLAETAWVAGLATTSLVLGRLGFITPWLAATGVIISGRWLELPDQTVVLGCITCYLLVEFSRAPDEVTGDALEAGPALANDPAIKANPRLIQRCLRRAGFKPSVLLISFVLPIPDLGFQLRGWPGLLVLAVLVKIGLGMRGISRASAAAQFKCFVFQSLTLITAWCIHGLLAPPNQLLVLTMIAGMAVPHAFSKVTPPTAKLTDEEFRGPWIGLTILVCLLTPGLTASAGGMMFLRRSVFRPSNLAFVGMWLEGWNLQRLCVGGANSKTPLADLLNRDYPNLLNHQFYLILALVMMISVLGIELLNQPWFCKVSSRSNAGRGLALSLGQSVAAGGLLWTLVFIAVGYLNTWFYRRFTPDADDARGFAFLTPMIGSW